MINDFVLLRESGHRTKLGEPIPEVGVIEQINDPIYKGVRYEWSHEGRTFALLIDGKNTINANPLADGSGLVVLQNEKCFGPDNVILLSPEAVILKRIENPYKHHADFLLGDQYWFYGFQIGKSEIVLDIQVQREPNIQPLYEAHFQSNDFKLLEIMWVPWR